MFKLSLKVKLLSLVVALLALQSVMAVVGFLSTNKVGSNYKHISDVNMVVFEKAALMSEAVFSIRAEVNRMAYQFEDSAEKADAIKRIDGYIEAYNTAVDEYKILPSQEGEDQYYEAIEVAWNKLRLKTKELIVVAQRSESVNDESQFQLLANELAIIAQKYRDENHAWLEFQHKAAKTWTEKASKTASQSNMVLIAISTFALFFGLGLGFFITHRLTQSLTKITESVSNASIQVSSASDELSHSSERLSSGSQQQASSLEETSASLTEISGMAESNVKGAEQADRAAKEVYEISEKTRESMAELAEAMGEILASNSRIEKLVKLIEEIGEKTEVIDDIVFKTQLLSFNASVEAERAGEHGRGFAVVAQEVGNLAQLSGKAALEISSIVKGSIKEAESVAAENKSRVIAGGELASDTKDQMEQVLNKLNGILESISKIVDASKEQGQGINQISTSVESISHLTQETASTAEETASASSELSVQSNSLMTLVSELKEVIRGEKIEKDEVRTSVSTHQEHSQDAQSHSAKVFQLKKKEKNSYFKSTSKKVANGSEVADSNASNDGDAWEKL